MMTTPGLSAAATAAIDALLPASVIGETFTISDRTFTRGYLRGDAEHALTNVVIDLVKAAPEKELGAMFLASLIEVRRAAAIILADLQRGDPRQLAQAIAETDEWLRTTCGTTNAALLNLVLAQVKLQDVGALLSSVFTLATATGIVRGDTQAAPAPVDAAAAPPVEA